LDRLSRCMVGSCKRLCRCRGPNGVLISEAGVPATVPASKGRIFVEIGSGVDTGFAVANPNDTAAKVSFFFTDRSGTDSAAGSFTLPAHGQVARFLDEAPFPVPRPALGTFTFTSDVPVSAIALRGLVNKRSEFLIINVDWECVSHVCGSSWIQSNRHCDPEHRTHDGARSSRA
jgi:hypothetical protein